MIIEEDIIVKWNGMNRKHYESFGYIFTHKGDEFTILTTQLPKNSHVFIKDQCENCKCIVEKEAYRTTKYCQPCTGRLVISEIAKNSHSVKLGNEKNRKRASEWCKKYNNGRKGENHQAYKKNKVRNDTDVRKSKEYWKWQRLIRTRDNSSCQCCLKKINVKKRGMYACHHLDGFVWAKEKRFDIENGIFLCTVCHIDFHKIYTNNNNTREQFFEWMSANFFTNFSSLNEILEFNKNV